MDEHGKNGPTGPDLTRRDLLKAAGVASAAALVPGALQGATDAAPGAATTLGTAERATAAAAATPVANLTARETQILATMIDRLIPTDELGPGALEAGALNYIDRFLSEGGTDTVASYRAGLAALDRYSEYTRGSAFVDLSERDQDSVLIDLQTGGAGGAGADFVGSSGGFFNMVRSHTWQATFGDPHYGGNEGFVGWDLINYPGVRMDVSDEDQRLLDAGELEPVRRSAYDYPLFRLDRLARDDRDGEG